MSAVTTERAAAPRVARISTKRLAALGRAELTLLLRNRSALFVALLLPIAMTFSIKSAAEQADISELGLSVGSMVLPGSVGVVLLFAVYSNLVGVYVARREELVLKRLRTGEANDLEILSAGALPSVALGVAQSVLLLVGGAVLLDMGAPERLDLVVAGVVLGMVMMTVLAAASASFARTTEMAQLIPMPMMLVSFAASGLFVPLEVFPDTLENVCRWLPMTPITDLLRAGVTGGLDGTATLRALGIAVAWTLLGAYGVRRRFRWEPRR
ncbi:ABC transporter permease [Streptomyces iconiensis]|uniref:Transport permease protein n=1 Tax=Streptomyces iconiensis TaxID=1384038 RepID=A0ABT7A068_9ACTN|nr:ABC transporter permease [Streptomyces iconiensis]MDJ1134722.1 ABC transporter permease [Streptomyces iconiensis]